MLVLAIETSCDETSAAVISAGGARLPDGQGSAFGGKNGGKILSNIVATQIEFHKKYGGIVPEIASRKHIEIINPVIQEALDKAKTSFKKIDAVAVTYGPGLVGSLLIGLCAAKTIAYAANKPLIDVNHLEGHIYANFLTHRERSEQGVSFPFVCLIVSGGHTMIVLVKNHGKYQIIGRTRDDAVGEAFDKVARFLGLGYPGGPIIDKIAKEGDPHSINFTRPMLEDGFDFSFSGIKTAVVNYVRKSSQPTTHPPAACLPARQGRAGNQTRNPIPLSQLIPDIAASFQQACVDVLVEKTIRAAEKFKVNTIALAGGVAANSLLRKEMKEKGESVGLGVIIPLLEYCTDNAAMIGCAAYYKFKRGKTSKLDLKPVANLSL